MARDLFDYVEESEPLTGQDGFEKFASRSPEMKESTWFETLKDYGKTALKGTAEGLVNLHQMASPAVLPGQSEKKKEKFTQYLDEKLPTEEGFGQKSLRRGLRQLPSNLSLPGGTATSTGLRTVLAGFFGQGAEELGAPEWAQSAAELTAYLTPNLTKTLLESGKDKDIIKAAKELGLTDEQVAPLVNSNFKRKWLSKLATKGERTTKKMRETKGALDKTYENIEASDVAKQALPDSEVSGLKSSIDKYLKKVPSQVAEHIEKDYATLLSEPVTGESLMNFWSKLNKSYGTNKAQLLPVKKFVGEAIEKVSPELRKDFKTINALYFKYYPLSKALRPKLSDEIANFATSMVGMGGIKILDAVLHANMPVMTSLLGAKAGKALASEFITNPKLQNTTAKFVKQLNDSKYRMAKHSLNLMAKELSSDFPEAADMIYDLSEKEFDEIFGSSED